METTRERGGNEALPESYGVFLFTKVEKYTLANFLYYSPGTSCGKTPHQTGKRSLLKLICFLIACLFFIRCIEVVLPGESISCLTKFDPCHPVNYANSLKTL